MYIKGKNRFLQTLLVFTAIVPTVAFANTPDTKGSYINELSLVDTTSMLDLPVINKAPSGDLKDTQDDLGLLLASVVAENYVKKDVNISTDGESSEIVKVAANSEITPQIVTIELNVVLQGRSIGVVTTETSLSRAYAVQSEQLATVLTPFVKTEVLTALSGLGNQMISVEELADIEIIVRLEAATLALVVEAPPKDTGPFNLQFGGGVDGLGEATIAPSNIAAGLTSTLQVNENFSQSGSLAASMAMSGFFNLGGIRGVNLDYGGRWIIDNGNGVSNFDFDRTILFMDDPKRARRYEAGTLISSVSPLSGVSDFLGLGITQSYRDIQPTRTLRPLGKRSFQLDRPSEVTVLVNGQELKRFDAPAGPVNLTDIPLADLSNDVSIVVEDEFGRRVAETFSVASDIFLLQDGLTEYFFGIGQSRDTARQGFFYNEDVLFTGNIQHAFSSAFTQGVYGHVDESMSIFGSQSAFALLDGLAQVEVSYSDTDDTSSGAAVAFDYRWNNSFASKRGQSFAATLEYRDQGYVPIGTVFGNDTKLAGTFLYDREITDRLRANFAVSYQERYSLEDPLVSVSLGTNYQFGRNLLNGAVRYTSDPNRSDELGFFVSLTRSLGRRKNLTASYDSISDRANLGFRSFPVNELGALGYEANIQTVGDEVSLRSGADYRANRFRGRLDLFQDSDGGAFDGDTRMTARLQSGIAFADGKFGIGRDPGRGFYMVSRHPSLSDAKINVSSGSIRDVRAKTGVLGPAVTTNIAPYVPETIQVQVFDAPIGYNIGQGQYVTIPGARSGYNIVVGSAAYRSAVAKFLANGEELALASGTLKNLEDGTEQIIFTNRSGRTAMSNLVPGQYELNFLKSEYVFRFTISKDSEVYVDMGNIELTKGEL